jgi:hypothetical protein
MGKAVFSDPSGVRTTDRRPRRWIVHAVLIAALVVVWG